MKAKILSGIIAFITASGAFMIFGLIVDSEWLNTLPEWTVSAAAFSYFGLIFFIFAVCMSYLDKDKK